ncbi:hypothetical protein OOT33_13850 [Sphingobium sp. DEHP117]|uniref:hypothetical protein n=1 Tax=Sphingobium sp. DEHP117 TaxID=2993436 RepID=UPI0027D68AB4|nr:hypothetical protein [Sphingobium sp. DEHP117]MDQ4421507.1 hypothetical protein [Sphingobium sp. DEHP117]
MTQITDSDREAMALVLKNSVITFGGVVQTNLGEEAAEAIQSTTAMAAEIERLKGVAAKADHARTCYARALEKMRIALVNINDGLEDEGDRIYLGSTNHADDIRAAWQIADSLKWDELLEHTQPETPIADTNLKLQAELDQLRREKAAAVTLLGRSLAYLQSTLGVTQDIRAFLGKQEQRT